MKMLSITSSLIGGNASCFIYKRYDIYTTIYILSKKKSVQQFLLHNACAYLFCFCCLMTFKSSLYIFFFSFDCIIYFISIASFFIKGVRLRRSHLRLLQNHYFYSRKKKGKRYKKSRGKWHGLL